MLSPPVAAFVAAARVARLATVDDQSRPHLVPVCFVYHDDVVYIALDEKPKRVPVQRLRRVRNLLANPRVQLLIDAYEEDWSLLAYIQLRGAAHLLSPCEEHARAIEELRAKYPQYRAMAIDSEPLIRIAVDGAVVWGSRFGVP